MQIILNQPLFVLSKKYYAAGEVVIEFITQDNKENNYRAELTFRNSAEADLFELGKEYQVSFQPKGEA